MDERKFLLDTGMMNRAVFAGIQADDCVVWKKAIGGGYQNSSLCNHSCVTHVGGSPTGGSYICDASFVFAKGSMSRFAPRVDIVRWTTNVAMGLKLARGLWFQNHFHEYCSEFRITPAWGDAIHKEMTDPNKKIETNRFGGSPEMLADCVPIIKDCQDAGLVVNLTTPGRRFMQDQKFVEEIAASPPNILAMSFDDMAPEEIARLGKMDLDEIRTEWKKISPLFGQRQKAFEGMYTARLMRQMNVSVTLLFNVVIHPGNVGHLNDVLGAITECVPGALANPYPAQSFNNELPCWTPSSLPALRSHILGFITGTLENKPGVTKRLHYYIALESVFRKWRDNPGRICEFMSGIRAWDCTLRPGGYRYAQIGKSMEVLKVPADNLPIPGGHLGCFWNPTLGLSEKVEDNIEFLAMTMLNGMVKRGIDLGPSVRKSNIMPRLMFDLVQTELGLPTELVPEYLATRREFAGF